MPPWLMELLLAGGGLGLIGTGIGSWFKARREDKRAERGSRQAEKAALEARVERLQAKVESLLMDALGRERETSAQLAEQIETNSKLTDIMAANTTALKESAQALARERKP